MTPKRGRPFKQPAQRRSFMLRVMLTPGERKALERFAASHGADMSVIVRQALRLAYTGATLQNVLTS